MKASKEIPRQAMTKRRKKSTFDPISFLYVTRFLITPQSVGRSFEV